MKYLDQFSSMTASVLIKGYLSFVRICFAPANWIMAVLCCIFAPALNIYPHQRIHMAVPSVTPFCLISDLSLHREQRIMFKSCKIHPAARKLTCATEQAGPVGVSDCDTKQAGPMEISDYTNSKFKNHFEMVGCNPTEFQVHLHMPPRKISAGWK